jgi:hypothetical protein
MAEETKGGVDDGLTELCQIRTSRRGRERVAVQTEKNDQIR